MPVIHMFAVNSSSSREDPAACYECPVYTDASRSRSVTTVDLKTAMTPTQCIGRGVALLCAAKP